MKTEHWRYVWRELGTTEDVAEILGVSRWTVWRMVKNGYLTPTRTSPSAPYRYSLADVERVIEGRHLPPPDRLNPGRVNGKPNK